jgi:hypothetical protein
MRGSQCRAPTNTPQKDTICHWDWGEGVAGFYLAQKGRAGDVIIMRWTMTMMTMARGGRKGKIINDSVSEYKAVIFLARTNMQKNNREQMYSDGIFWVFICVVLLRHCICRSQVAASANYRGVQWTLGFA